ncbi:hypothetical protein ABB37_08224 [Leptomonas pyrrhocoris]|uniref:Uncharacterized protein n=1 Tax=Leptomonas pyrrhocoris TaxID=157538 RepID=A0A0M9FTI2_LEPPY|nr:hypothetical protein ABB37_08224 [Leptomonas pyrrhocoris]KPA75657.1 hypothetical protein ABB37_08224 [Leptomonas pyrrhocoris]|eukprot:XP_015654096.1 hypothetical protein ABB37_08224 [Leptomonas pyrrhocoris]
MEQTTTSSTSVRFHALPIQTDFEGTTDISENFTAAMTQDPQDHLRHAALRGRRLLGKEVRLPDDYAVALVAVTDNTPDPSSWPSSSAFATAGEKERSIVVENNMLVQAAAPSYMQWEHDRPPAAAAAVPQWIALASILHSSE